MKTILLCVVFVCCVLIGIGIGSYYKKRRDFYVDVCNFCDYSSSQISFALKKINEIVCDCKNNCQKEFFIYLATYERLLAGELTSEEFVKQTKINFLTQEEKSELDGMFLSLGQMNRDEEIEKIAICKKNFGGKKVVCNEKFTKYNNLYFKLFFLFGLAIIVIFL